MSTVLSTLYPGGCEGGEGVIGLKWFDMHVIVFVMSRAFK